MDSDVIRTACGTDSPTPPSSCDLHPCPQVRELEGTLEDIGAKEIGAPTRARSIGLNNTGGGAGGSLSGRVSGRVSGSGDVPTGALAELRQKISELQSQVQMEADKGSSARAAQASADSRLADLEQRVAQAITSPSNSPMAGEFVGVSGRDSLCCVGCMTARVWNLKYACSHSAPRTRV
jgi:hypothetical protein